MFIGQFLCSPSLPNNFTDVRESFGNIPLAHAIFGKPCAEVVWI